MTVAKAARRFARFTGHTAEVIGKVNVTIPKAGAVIGTVDGILYTTVRDGVTEKYIHKFNGKSKPLFVVSEDGTQILLIGGKYKFTERGIVDKG